MSRLVLPAGDAHGLVDAEHKQSTSCARYVPRSVIARRIVGLHPYSGKSPYVSITIVDLQPLENAAAVGTLGRHFDQPDPHVWMRALSEPEEERLRRQ